MTVQQTLAHSGTYLEEFHGILSQKEEAQESWLVFSLLQSQEWPLQMCRKIKQKQQEAYIDDQGDLE